MVSEYVDQIFVCFFPLISFKVTKTNKTKQNKNHYLLLNSLKQSILYKVSIHAIMLCEEAFSLITREITHV